MMRATILTVALVALAGCITPQDREEHAAAYAEQRADVAAKLAEHDRPLTLDDCVNVALGNNLAIQAAKLEERLAGISTNMAFANFLPRVEAEMSQVRLTETPLLKLGNVEAQTTDQSKRDIAISAQQPVFVPTTWYLYSAMQRGEEIKGLVTELTRRHVVLAVTARYYSCQALIATRPGLESGVRQADDLLADARAREVEGLLTAAVLEEVEAYRLSRRAALDANERAILTEKAVLLQTMGLPPDVGLALAEPGADEAIEIEPLADLVTTALMERPEMFLADRTIDVRRDQVRMAVAEFLPKLVLTGGWTDTTDSFLVNPASFHYGFAGMMTLFSGFSNIQDYRAARVREEAAYLEREQAAMTVVLEVIQAHHNVLDAVSDVEITGKLQTAAELRLTETEALYEEGMAEDSDRLAAVHDRDQARSVARAAGFRGRVAVATLRDVTGRSGSDS